jgi:iron-sulfur cluster assembly accessory protein
MAVETAKGGSRLSISITEQCLQRLRALASRQNDSLPPALRITVNSGGCAGFQYEFKLEHGEPLADDYVFERDGVRVYVDALSAPMITGSTLDYEEELIRSAFKIETNPNAEAGCSCGTSFAPKL